MSYDDEIEVLKRAVTALAGAVVHLSAEAEITDYRRDMVLRLATEARSLVGVRSKPREARQ